MQNRDQNTKYSVKNHDATDDAQEPSFMETISNATGWLNPLNLARATVNKTLVVSSLIYNAVIQADSRVCFGTIDPNTHKVAEKYSIDCSFIWGVNFDGIPSACGDVVTYAWEDCANDISIAHKSYGQSTLFKTDICVADVYKRKHDSHLLPCIDHKLESTTHGLNVQDRLTTGDILGLMAITVGGATAIVLAYSAILHCRNKRRMQAGAHDYDKMTRALAENDKKLVKEIYQVARDAGIELPKDALALILTKTDGYNDSFYRDVYINSGNVDPNPPGLRRNAIKGKNAPWIRFYDDKGRKAARNKAINEAYDEIKEKRTNTKNSFLLFNNNNIQNEEAAPLLGVSVEL